MTTHGKSMLSRILLLFAITTVTAVYADEAPSTGADAGGSAAEMAVAAAAFIAALSPEQREVSAFAMDADEVRTSWSNLPAMFVERRGLPMGEMSDQQRRRLHALLRASTSSQGYQKLAGVIRLDDVLHAEAARAVERGTRKLPPELVNSWSSRNYWVAFFGSPGKDKVWGWQLSGHHLAANFTVVDSRLSFTPIFLGAEPNEVQTGPEAGWRVLSHEALRGYELLQSLDPRQRDRAALGDSLPEDIFTGPGRKGSLQTYSGIPASTMNADQRILLWAVIDEFIGDVDHDAAAAQRRRIQADGMDKLWFAWIGAQDDISGRYYYRIHGPSVLIEYVVQEGVGGAAANHVHSIVRDPGNDYGEDWLGKHYEEHHHRIR